MCKWGNDKTQLCKTEQKPNWSWHWRQFDHYPDRILPTLLRGWVVARALECLQVYSCLDEYIQLTYQNL